MSGRDALHERALRLERELAQVLCGRDEAARGLVLALLAGRSALLEGPPGCGKSALVASALRAWGESSRLLAGHRDLRVADLDGDTVLRRWRTPRGERLSFATRRPAPVGVWQVDDFERVPEAVRAGLVERTRGPRGAPLFATAGSTGLDALAAASESAPGASCEVFAVQLRLEPLLGRSADAARRLIDRACANGASGPAPQAWSAAQRAEARAAVGALPVPPAVRTELRALCAPSGPARATWLPDRTLLRDLVPLLRAHAFLRGAERVAATDLAVLRFALGRRLAPDARARVLEAVASFAAREAEPDGAALPLAGPDDDPRERGPGAATSGGAGASDEPARVVELDATQPAPSQRPAAAPALAADDLAPLLTALSGRLGRRGPRPEPSPAGVPRGWQPLRSFAELEDADPLDAVLLAEASLGHARALRRERPERHGSLAVLRDVSASMEGRLGRWAGQVSAALLRLGSARRMRVGYVEFNHVARAARPGGRFFASAPQALLERVAAARAEGRTSYQAPLRAALDAFATEASGDRHVVLLTDGIPVAGDPSVARERVEARRRGVRVHTVFIGLGDCPEVLDRLSRETGGTALCARPGPGGRIRVALRTPALAAAARPRLALRP